jgi:hypothetical protein
MIPWRDLLLLLEGQPVHFPTPKNHYKDDIYLTRDTPIFATGKKLLPLSKVPTMLVTRSKMK